VIGCEAARGPNADRREKQLNVFTPDIGASDALLNSRSPAIVGQSRCGRWALSRSSMGNVGLEDITS
jgi:hypothetical protein